MVTRIGINRHGQIRHFFPICNFSLSFWPLLFFVADVGSDGSDFTSLMDAGSASETRGVTFSSVTPKE